MLLTSHRVLWGEHRKRKHNCFLCLSMTCPCQEQVWRATAHAEPPENICTTSYLCFLTQAMNKEHSLNPTSLLSPSPKKENQENERKTYLPLEVSPAQLTEM